MPELPEVETVRRSLLARVIGRRVVRVRVRRPGVVTGKRSPSALLQGLYLTQVHRHGKQLAIQGATRPDMGQQGPCVCVHLGMSGSLRHYPAADSDGNEKPMSDPHTHVLWHLDDGSILVFHDPRRFGGLWTFSTIPQLLHNRWHCLGPDALRINASNLHRSFQKTSRCVKAVLLDQKAVAGLGNIYVDELLFNCRVHPATRADSLSIRQSREMIRETRRLLRQAISQGGSTFRDYRDAAGQAGTFQSRHHVYGKSGKACSRCEHTLRSTQVAGRTTVFCQHCQEPPIP